MNRHPDAARIINAAYSRRKFLAVLCAFLVLGVAGQAHAGFGPFARGGAGVVQTGFLPAGHFAPSQQSLTQIFPQPDASTASTAREHWAYWDGTNDVPYDLAIGAAFGAYPYVFTLLSGPPGMSIEQPTYTTFQNVQYGRIIWHPQGNISTSWTGTVSVEVTDQEHNSITISWTLSTSSATTHFVFVSTTGSGTACTYSAPCTFPTAFTSGSFPGAICYAFGGSYSGATNFPAGLSLNSASYPNALIGIPGSSVTLDASTTATLMDISYQANDWYMENITANGYDASAVDKLITMNASRITFDQVKWTNSGYGTGTNSNMSMFESGAAGSPRKQLFITDSEESNRESGHAGNNFGFIDAYSYTDSLVQRSTENSPSATLDSVFFYKSDITYSELREDYANVAGSTSGFGYGQAQFSGMGNDESDYNLGLNITEVYFGNAGDGAYTYPPFALARNTIISGTGQSIRLSSTSFNLEGPGGASGGLITMSSTTGGSLTAGTQYTCGITSLGVTGESATIIGTNGNSGIGTVAGSSNQNTITLATGDSAIALSWLAEPGATGYNGYCEVAGSGVWTQYSLGNVTSWTYTGAAGTSASPPASSTAVSAARFSFLSNALSTTYTPMPPTASFVVNTGNVADASGTDQIINADGTLNPSYSGYAALIGIVGYQIQ